METPIQTVQRMYKDFREGNLAAILDLMADDVEWFLFGSVEIPWAGMWRGRQGVKQFFKTVAEVSEVEDFPDEFMAAGDNVIVLGHQRVRVRATSRLVETHWAVIWTLREGKVSRYCEYNDTAALEAGFNGAKT